MTFVDFFMLHLQFLKILLTNYNKLHEVIEFSTIDSLHGLSLFLATFSRLAVPN